LYHNARKEKCKIFVDAYQRFRWISFLCHSIWPHDSAAAACTHYQNKWH